mgnify:CR=1 FL=1
MIFSALWCNFRLGWNFRYLVLESIIPESVVELVNSPKLWQHLPKVLSPEKVDDLIAAPSRTDRTPLRDRAMLALMYATGCRASEVCGIALRDIQLEQGYCRCVGKGNKELWDKFMEYYNAVFAEGALSEREKALIALAVAHTVQCPYCIDAYTQASLEKGSNIEEMTEAVHVACAIRGGASLVHGVQMRNVAENLSM